MHGRVVPEVYVDATNAQGHPVGQVLLYPRLNEVDKYLDWRIAFNEAGGATPSPNFAKAAQIGRGAWELVVGYVESGVADFIGYSRSAPRSAPDAHSRHLRHT